MSGWCSNLIGGYTCTCPGEFTGPNCGNINLSCPTCQNKAIECQNGHCVCSPGYVGPDCGKGKKWLQIDDYPDYHI